MDKTMELPYQALRSESDMYTPCRSLLLVAPSELSLTSINAPALLGSAILWHTGFLDYNSLALLYPRIFA